MYSEYLDLLKDALQRLEGWRESYGSFEPHSANHVEPEQIQKVFSQLTDRLRGNYPFHHPVYIGQMLKPPHPVAWMAYSLAMTINPNNHALDGGPPTSHMEKEVVEDLASMVGWPGQYLGHLTGGGTMANLEALWVARHEHPQKGIAFSDQAHYTHGRMCEVLRLPSYTVESDDKGRMLLERLAELEDEIGTVVVTMGTTGLGSIDPLSDILEWARPRGIRVHVDAAYGGFFKLIEEDPNFAARKHWQHIHQADSLVIDPHKHGLQPYGCGCILFRDPEVGRYYKHDSPYTYFTSDELHLGEISLECSRAGASAAALWATLQLLPLSSEKGVGPILRACRTAATSLYNALNDSSLFRPISAPELDIVGYFPVPEQGNLSASAISELSRQIFEEGMNRGGDGFYASLFKIDSGKLNRIYPDITIDSEQTTVLRSVLMKPEHESFVADLMDRLSDSYHQMVSDKG